jgi:hypothetical protein
VPVEPGNPKHIGKREVVRAKWDGTQHVLPARKKPPLEP